MQQASLILGIIAIVGMFIGLFPCLGWLNWLVIPLGITGLILGIIDYSSAEPKQNYPENPYPSYQKPFPTGILINGIVIAIGTLRLIIGGGVL